MRVCVATHRVLLLAIIIAAASNAACSSGGTTADAAPREGGSDASGAVADVLALDEPDADVDASASPDESAPDAGPDAWLDAGSDVALDVAPDAGPTPLPDRCSEDGACGVGARCETSANRCVCATGYLPCGAACCMGRVVREVTLDMQGHGPEIAADAMGRIYVLYKRGARAVQLATVGTDGAVRTESIATSSGREDDFDLAVTPEGGIFAVVHQDGVDRAGRFTLFRRDPGAGAFTSMRLLLNSVDTSAFNAAVSIARAPNGDLYAATSLLGSSGGAQGLAMSRYDAAAGVWMGLPAVLMSGQFAYSELLATNAGCFLGVQSSNSQPDRWVRFDGDGTQREVIATASTTQRTLGDLAGALTDAGALVSLVDRTVRLDATHSESLEFSGMESGERRDIDMAIDRDGNPALLLHSITTHAMVLKVRMPRGGWTSWATSESTFVPVPAVSRGVTLDLERLPSGALALAYGDSEEQGPLRLRVIDR